VEVAFGGRFIAYEEVGASVVVIASLFVVGLATVLYIVAMPEPSIGAPADIFDFTSLRKSAADSESPPSLRRYPARDGEQLAYRVYDSAADRILIFIHGSSYHGGGYHALASALSLAGAAKVVLPNLRGHYMSGPRRGDVDYIGQYEDDIADLIKFLRSEAHSGPITLGGHSSGGGLSIRFSGGPYANEVSSYLLIAPIIPRSPAVRGGTAGGWTILHWKRVYGLIALNIVGIRGFNGLPIIQFNKPAKYWDGTETLCYSYRLNVSYHPHLNYDADMRALSPHTLVLVGGNDNAVDGEALQKLIAADVPPAKMKILPGVSHLGICSDPTTLDLAATWMRALPR
jgi:non-heme chloroperoxidase